MAAAGGIAIGEAAAWSSPAWVAHLVVEVTPTRAEHRFAPPRRR